MPGTSVNMSGLAPAKGDKTFGADPGSAFTPITFEPTNNPQNRLGVSANTCKTKILLNL